MTNTEARAMLQNYLELLARSALLQSPTASEYNPAYHSAAEFLLTHGGWFEPVPYPPNGHRGAPKSCYGNAIYLGTLNNWKYIEGYALAPILEIGGFPTAHAWNVTPEGVLIDSTWRNTGLAYFGVEFSVERADEATWDGDASILNDWHRGYPLFQKPWTGETPQPASKRISLLRARKFRELYVLMAKEGR
jgi:hypothetical protein